MRKISLESFNLTIFNKISLTRFADFIFVIRIIYLFKQTLMVFEDVDTNL